MPEPDAETVREFLAAARLTHDGVGPLVLDRTVMLGGLPNATDAWRHMRNAYRFSRANQTDRMLVQLAQLAGVFGELPDDNLRIERALLLFFTRLLAPRATSGTQRIVDQLQQAITDREDEMSRLRAHFARARWERMDEYMDLLDHFFRAYDEFNQTFMYARLGVDLPGNPYAPSTDFENTKLYYGEAFEVLGAQVDFLVAVNNVLSGRDYDRLDLITLEKFKASDKGRRAGALATNFELNWLVSEYENKLRNASHHRWLKLSPDRSLISYREGGDGDVRSMSYAEYLFRCCKITTQIIFLASAEIILLAE